MSSHKKLQISTKSIKKEKGFQLKNVETFSLDLYLLYQQFCWPFFLSQILFLTKLFFQQQQKLFFEQKRIQLKI